MLTLFNFKYSIKNTVVGVYNGFLSVIFMLVERNGSGVELRTLDYENPGSSPVRRQDGSLYIAPVHSAVYMSMSA